MHGDGSDSAKGTQPVGEGRRTPQIERVGNATAADLAHSAPQKAELGIEHARRADHRTDLELIAGPQTAQHQCAVKAAAGAHDRAQARAHSRRSSSASASTDVRTCTSVCSLLMKNSSRAERSCTAGKTIGCTLILRRNSASESRTALRALCVVAGVT